MAIINQDASLWMIMIYTHHLQYGIYEKKRVPALGWGSRRQEGRAASSCSFNYHVPQYAYH